MSWSCGSQGLASIVRENIGNQLSQAAKTCKHIPSESASIQAFASAVDAVCASAEGQCIIVMGSGSAWMVDDKLRSFSFSGSIQVIDVQPPRTTNS